MMKEKKITITSKDISQKQFSNLLLELNLMKKQWNKFAKLDIQAPGIKRILDWGTTNYDSKANPNEDEDED